MDGEPVSMGLWDTAGQADYDRLRPLSYPQTDVFLICYSIIRQSSFENIKTKWIPEIEAWTICLFLSVPYQSIRSFPRISSLSQKHCPDARYLIVGTKTDLRGDMEAKGGKELDESDGMALAKEVKAHCYCECSALTQNGLKDVFQEAARAAVQKQNEQAAKNEKKCLIL